MIHIIRHINLQQPLQTLYLCGVPSYLCLHEWTLQGIPLQPLVTTPLHFQASADFRYRRLQSRILLPHQHLSAAGLTAQILRNCFGLKGWVNQYSKWNLLIHHWDCSRQEVNVRRPDHQTSYYFDLAISSKIELKVVLMKSWPIKSLWGSHYYRWKMGSIYVVVSCRILKCCLTLAIFMSMHFDKILSSLCLALDQNSLHYIPSHYQLDSV